MPHGTVRWFDTAKGFGFLAPEIVDGVESPDVFVHASEVLTDGGPRVLKEGQAVDFEVGEGPRGPQALEVRIVGDVAPDAPLGVLATVTWYEPGKGYGFATPEGGGTDVFVHSSALVTGGVLAAGQRVAFLVEPGEKGPQATHVLPLGMAPVVAGDGADGTVTWYEDGKGFGFIAPDAGGPDVFVHANALVEGLAYLAPGDRVAFDVAQGDRGPQARDVSLVSEGADAVPSGGAPGPAPVSSSRGGEGVVARYDAERGFGFVTPDDGGPDLFVHVSVLEGADALEAGERVRFGVRQSDRGPQADKVERL
ncbi:MAG: cold-shock protein [Frankiales bacterium]|nr:cold-shock protein [Frankiales bacterium]